LIPRAINARATPRSDLMPLACICWITGSTLAANRSAAFLLAALQQSLCLFDHFVGAAEQRRRNFEPKRPSGLEIDD
jgi:hypothetical protein